MNILDPRFKYRDHAHTDVADTFKRHGFKPTTPAERAARQRPAEAQKKTATVTPLKRKPKEQQA